MGVYILELIAVVVWNFGVLGAAPIQDVIIAVTLSFLSIGLKKIIK